MDSDDERDDLKELIAEFSAKDPRFRLPWPRRGAAGDHDPAQGCAEGPG